MISDGCAKLCDKSQEVFGGKGSEADNGENYGGRAKDQVPHDALEVGVSDKGCGVGRGEAKGIYEEEVKDSNIQIWSNINEEENL